MPRHPYISRNWGIALLLCVVAVGGFQTASAETDRLSPASAVYLQSALERYLTIEKQGGWPTVPDGPALRVGSFGPSVARLKERLSVTNDLTGQSRNSREFDDDLNAAVIHFQSRHGLVADGVVGRKTRAALNISVGERVQQIMANRARLQSSPATDGSRMILINVAGFDLNVVEDGMVTFSSPVIVGRLSRPTPVLSSVVTKIIVNPYWRVPRRIAIEDILPKLKQNPSYLSAQAIRVYKASGSSLVEMAAESVPWQALNEGNFPYTLVQEPGSSNSLGHVKFFLPNEQAIFVHDTPARGLFKRGLRAFSSGCIRVDKAVELAEYLLKHDGEGSFHALAEALQSGETRQIALSGPVPIHIIYLTAWADKYGHAHFRDDIYALDGLVDTGPAHQKEAHRDVARAYETANTPACTTMATPTGVLQ